MKINVPINGMTTTATYNDGDARYLINARNKNGVIKPVYESEVVSGATINNSSDIVFVHRPSDNTENYINTVTSYDSCTVYNGTTPITTSSVSRIYTIEAVGNIVVLYADGKTYYMLYKNTSYTWLGEFPEMPAFSWDAPMRPAVVTNVGVRTAFNKTTQLAELLEDAKATIGLVMKDIDDTLKKYQQDRFYDAFYLCLALRLYDGSFIKQTGPYLILPNDDIKTVKTVTCNFDNTNARISDPAVKGFRLGLQVLRSSLSGWADVIKSIDIFISPALGLTALDNAFATTEIQNTSLGGFPDLTYYPIPGSPVATGIPVVSELTDTVINNMKTAASFFLIRSIEISSTDTSAVNLTFPSTEEDYYTLYNLTNQEKLSFDNPIESYGAKKSYLFNNRIHLWDVKKKISRGYRVNDFITPKPRYNGLSCDTYVETARERRPYYLIIRVTLEDGSFVYRRDGLPYTEVEAPWDLRTYTNYKAVPAFFCYPDSTAKKVAFGFCLGDSLMINYDEYDLKPHEYLNIAYFLNIKDNDVSINTEHSGYKYIKRIGVAGSLDGFTEPYYNDVYTSEPTKMKVTASSNPFILPYTNTYDFGTKIMSVRTNAFDVSSAQFGSFPLYVFCENIIYAMSSGTGSVVYPSKSVIKEADVISDVAKSTPYGILFFLSDGLYLLSGSDMKRITPHLEEDFVAFTQQNNDELPDAQDMANYNFLTYIKNVSSIVYNGRENEIILVGTEYYNYVINILSGATHLFTREIAKPILNSENGYCVSINNNVIDVETSGTTMLSAEYLSRPIRFGDEDYKKMRRVIVRGRFFGDNNNNNNVKCIIYGSNDGKNFVPVIGSQYNVSSPGKKDIDFGRITIDCRYYSVCLILDGERLTDYEVKLVETDVEASHRKIR